MLNRTWIIRSRNISSRYTAFLMERPATAKLPFLRSDCKLSSERFWKSFYKSEVFRVLSRTMYQGRSMFHCMRRRRLRSLQKMPAFTTQSICESITRFYGSPSFFSLSSGSSGVKSISVKIGEKFMWRCRQWSGGLHGTYCGPFLACATRVSWPPSLEVFERMYAGSESKHRALE